MENKIRNTLNEIYFGKTKDIVNGLRSVQPLAEANKMKDLQASVHLTLVEFLGIFFFTVLICEHNFQNQLFDKLQQKNAGQTN